ATWPLQVGGVAVVDGLGVLVACAETEALSRQSHHEARVMAAVVRLCPPWDKDRLPVRRPGRFEGPQLGRSRERTPPWIRDLGAASTRHGTCMERRRPRDQRGAPVALCPKV